MTHYDPNLGPVHSALTLRLWLAGFGLVFCGVAAGVCAAAGGPVGLTVVLAVLAAVAVVDIAVIARRKRRGEPG
jgi:hypothetical protein